MLDKIENVIRRWPWESTVTPLYATVMILQGFVLCFLSHTIDTPSYQILIQTLPPFIWGIIYTLVGLLVLVGTYKRPRRYFEFLQAGLVFLEGLFIFLSFLHGYDTPIAATFRVFMIAIIIWISLLRRTFGEPEYHIIPKNEEVSK